MVFQQIEEKVWKQINGASETDSPCWPTDELCLFGNLLEFIWLLFSILLYTKFYFVLLNLFKNDTGVQLILPQLY